MKRLSVLAVAAALAGLAAPAAFGCGGERASSARAGSGVTAAVGSADARILTVGDRFIGADGKERGVGGFESHAVDFDRDAARAGHDIRGRADKELDR
jgi:hypothetical protein